MHSAMWCQACSRTGSASSWSAGVMRRSSAPVHSAAFVAYLATYAATLLSVSSPVVVMGRMSSSRPQASPRGQARGDRRL
jgi:hypothetical protein